MGIVSIGHRLTILKGIYDIKIKQDIPIDSDHWIPPCTLPLPFEFQKYALTVVPQLPTQRRATLLQPKMTYLAS